MLKQQFLVTGGYQSSSTYILRSDPADPTSLHWANGAPLPTTRGGLMCSQVHVGTTQKVIVAGGKHGQVHTHIVEVYDVAQDAWDKGMYKYAIFTPSY